MEEGAGTAEAINIHIHSGLIKLISLFIVCTYSGRPPLKLHFTQFALCIWSGFVLRHTRTKSCYRQKAVVLITKPYTRCFVVKSGQNKLVSNLLHNLQEHYYTAKPAIVDLMLFQ